MTTIDTQSIETKQEDIEAFVSETLETIEQRALAARIDMYALLADAYRYPDALTRVYVRNGELKSDFMRIAESLPYAMAMDDQEANLLVYPDSVVDDDVEADFIRFFEAGPGHPPCPLVEGIHMSKENGRRTIFKDLILFYNNFGLSYAEGCVHDSPDHITYEMEFLHYLAFLELKTLQKGKDPRQLQWAQKDFIERHPAQWTCLLADRMKKIEVGIKGGVNKGMVTFYRNLMVLTDRFVCHDLKHMTSFIED